MGYKPFMDANKTEVSPETLRTAMLGDVLLDEAKTVIDEKQKPC
jgi:hypothetical protein